MEIFLTILKYGLVVYLIMDTLNKHLMAYKSVTKADRTPMTWLITLIMAVALVAVQMLVFGGVVYAIIYIISFLS